MVTLSFPGTADREIKCRVVWAGPAEGTDNQAGLAFVASPNEIRTWVYNLIFDEKPQENQAG